MVDFGIKIRELRKKKGLTQQQLAERVGVTKAMFQSGTLAETRQLINLYVEKVVVYPDKIDLRINMINFVSNILSAGDNAQLSKIPAEGFAEDKSITRKNLNMGKDLPR